MSVCTPRGNMFYWMEEQQREGEVCLKQCADGISRPGLSLSLFFFLSLTVRLRSPLFPGCSHASRLDALIRWSARTEQENKRGMGWRGGGLFSLALVPGKSFVCRQSV